MRFGGILADELRHQGYGDKSVAGRRRKSLESYFGVNLWPCRKTGFFGLEAERLTIV